MAKWWRKWQWPVNNKERKYIHIDIVSTQQPWWLQALEYRENDGYFPPLSGSQTNSLAECLQCAVIIFCFLPTISWPGKNSTTLFNHLSSEYIPPSCYANMLGKFSKDVAGLICQHCQSLEQKLHLGQKTFFLQTLDFRSTCNWCWKRWCASQSQISWRFA